MVNYRDRYPGEEFQFVSFNPVDRDVIVIDRDNKEESFSKIQRMHQDRCFDGILNIREKYVRTAAALAEHLGMPPLVQDPELARDKWKQRLRLSAGAESKSVYLIREPRDLEAIPESFFPCVLKPRFGFNSRSVALIEKPAMLKKWYARNRKYYSLMKNEDTSNRDFIVEEVFHGTEHTVEAFVQSGKIIFSILSDKESMPAPYFIETGDFMPSRLPEKTQSAIRNAAQAAVAALGIRFGWSHIEVKWDGHKAVVIEAAARMGGGYFGEMIQLVYGIDRLRILMDAFRDAPLSFPEKPRTAVKGHRIVGMGLTFAGKLEKIGREMTRSKSIKLVWPEKPEDIKKVIIGPPFGYKNTLFEYFIVQDDPEAAQRIFMETLPRLEPVRWRVPGFIAGAVWGIAPFITRCRRNKVLDV